MPEFAPASAFEQVPLRRLSARLVAHDWPWAREHAQEIARGWQDRLVQRPRMFDGRVLLSRACAIRDGTCTVELFAVRFSQFVAYRAAGFSDGEGSTEGARVENAFAAIVPHTADGAVLLGEMGAHTANAGQLYFPCGTPDMDDVRAGGLVDLAGSAGREFAEETGLALPSETDDTPWTLLRRAGQLAFLRPVRLAQDADALIAQAAAHNAREAEPELARVVAVRGRAGIDPERMPGFVCAYLAGVFGT